LSKEKIKKPKDTWILFPIPSTKKELHFEIGKITKTRTTKRPHHKMFNTRANEHKQNIIKT
jgi:hypothetical protein